MHLLSVLVFALVGKALNTPCNNNILNLEGLPPIPVHTVTVVPGGEQFQQLIRQIVSTERAGCGCPCPTSTTTATSTAPEITTYVYSVTRCPITTTTTAPQTTTCYYDHVLPPDVQRIFDVMKIKPCVPPQYPPCDCHDRPPCRPRARL